MRAFARPRRFPEAPCSSSARSLGGLGVAPGQLLHMADVDEHMSHAARVAHVAEEPQRPLIHVVGLLISPGHTKDTRQITERDGLAVAVRETVKALQRLHEARLGLFVPAHHTMDHRHVPQCRRLPQQIPGGESAFECGPVQGKGFAPVPVSTQELLHRGGKVHGVGAVTVARRVLDRRLEVGVLGAHPGSRAIRIGNVGDLRLQAGHIPQLGSVVAVEEAGGPGRGVEVVVQLPLQCLMYGMGSGLTRERTGVLTDEVVHAVAATGRFLDEVMLLDLLKHAAGVRHSGVLPCGGPVGVHSWRTELTRVVDAWAERHPLAPGMPRAAAARMVGLPDSRLLGPLIGATVLVSDATGVRRPGSGGALPEAVLGAVGKVRERLESTPFAPPSVPELKALGLTRKHLSAAEQNGLLLRITDDVCLLPDAARTAVSRLAALPQPFTVSRGRACLGTSRRVAVPLFEYLDRLGLTVRTSAQERRLRTGGPAISGPDGSDAEGPWA